MFNAILCNSAMLVLLLYFADNLSLKLTKNKIKFLTVTFLFLIVMIFLYVHKTSVIYSFFIQLFYLVYLCIMTNGKFIKKFLCVLIFVIINGTLDVLLFSIMHTSFNELNKQLGSFAQTFGIMMTCFFTFLCILLCKRILIFKETYAISHSMYLIFLLPITTIALTMYMCNEHNSFQINFPMAMISIGMIGSNFFLLILFFKIIQSMKLKEELKETKSRLSFINTLYDTNFKFQHDMIRNVAHLNTLLTNKQYDQLQHQIHEINRFLVKNLNTITSNASIPASLINSKLPQIDEHSIILKTIFEYPDFDFMNAETQFSFFDMLLELSIHSCRHSQNKSPIIILKTKKNGKHVLLQCMFSASPSDKIKKRYYRHLEKLITVHHGLFDIAVDKERHTESIFIYFPI